MGCNETIPSQHLENLWFCVFAVRGLFVLLSEGDFQLMNSVTSPATIS